MDQWVFDLTLFLSSHFVDAYLCLCFFIYIMVERWQLEGGRWKVVNKVLMKKWGRWFVADNKEVVPMVGSVGCGGRKGG